MCCEMKMGKRLLLVEDEVTYVHYIFSAVRKLGPPRIIGGERRAKTNLLSSSLGQKKEKEPNLSNKSNSNTLG